MRTFFRQVTRIGRCCIAMLVGQTVRSKALSRVQFPQTDDNNVALPFR